VDELPTHGGSLRIYGKHAEDQSKQVSSNVSDMLKKEKEAGLTSMEYYQGFQLKALKVKLDVLDFLIQQKRNNKVVAAYGAAAKGNTLLNFCGIKNDLISFVVDANPHKQDKYLPASHIPVTSEKMIKEIKPDYIMILPWNLKEELVNQLQYIREWNGKFVIPIPTLQIID
jgi:hypothetical protein